jgi:hypothetical protein
MNLRYLLLAPALGLSSLFTACETDRVVYTSSGPGYDYDDTDFYYQGSAPYSRSYGVLVLRDGGYYYNRGGHYYAYTRHTGHRGGYDHRRSDGNYNRDRVVTNNAYRNDRVDVRTQPSARYSTTNRVQTGGYHGTATRTNVNVQRPGVSATTRAGGQPTVEVKKGKHAHDHDRDHDRD